MTKTIGEFQISVGAPYPCWCSIQTANGDIRFSHQDLNDLEHAVKEMKKEARSLLPKCDRGEVG